MRLLNTQTRRFKEFYDTRNVKYAILSHRWIEDEEVSYQEYLLITEGDGLLGASAALHRRSTLEQKRASSGFRKIRNACRQATTDGLEWIWIDTCCIDKTSSAELSEAINSMWKWYGSSSVCYAYLADVDHDGDRKSKAATQSFAQSQWFTRGWTLQELLAPVTVRFYNRQWDFIADKATHRDLISQITGIDGAFLGNNILIFRASVNTRMRWAAGRATSRIEDAAYCLLGLFAVTMPLLYGEGEKAFVRLQKEIIAQSSDESILAHKHITTPLARKPEHFILEDTVLGGLALKRSWYTSLGLFPFSINNKGMQWTAAFVRGLSLTNGRHVAALNCCFESRDTPLLLLLETSHLGRPEHNGYVVIPWDRYHNRGPGECLKAATDLIAQSIQGEPKRDPFEYKTIILLGHY